jgi:hypothetical protein
MSRYGVSQSARSGPAETLQSALTMDWRLRSVRSGYDQFRGVAGARPRMDSSREIQDQAGWDEHAAFMNRLADGGFIIAGGPVGNGEQTLHTVEAA